MNRTTVLVCCAPTGTARTCRAILGEIEVGPSNRITFPAGLKWRSTTPGSFDVECPRHGWATITVEELRQPLPARGRREVHIHEDA